MNNYTYQFFDSKLRFQFIENREIVHDADSALNLLKQEKIIHIDLNEITEIYRLIPLGQNSYARDEKVL